MKRIDISTSKHPNTFTMVDDADYVWLADGSRWFAAEKRNKIYAVRGVFRDGKKTTEKMHRVIIQSPPGFEVDHRNGDGLDNQRDNLRICTVNQNQYNRGPQKNNTSGYKGVSFSKRNKKWRADIKFNMRKISLGYFTSAKEAANAYALAAVSLHGEFARLV